MGSKHPQIQLSLAMSSTVLKMPFVESIKTRHCHQNHDIVIVLIIIITKIIFIVIVHMKEEDPPANSTHLNSKGYTNPMWHCHPLLATKHS